MYIIRSLVVRSTGGMNNTGSIFAKYTSPAEHATAADYNDLSPYVFSLINQ
jgi:hypothetical protein